MSDRDARPPVLFLHGLFSNPTLVTDWIEFLESAGYACHAPAMPGHEPVDPNVLSRITLSDYVDHALAVYDELDEAPIVIGHSIGGLIAHHVAAARSPRALVLLASVPPGVLWPQLRYSSVWPRRRRDARGLRQVRAGLGTRVQVDEYGHPGYPSRAASVDVSRGLARLRRCGIGASSG
jgi:pimeloyl-ACP methyl ester carboxylesterase